MTNNFKQLLIEYCRNLQIQSILKLRVEDLSLTDTLWFTVLFHKLMKKIVEWLTLLWPSYNLPGKEKLII